MGKLFQWFGQNHINASQDKYNFLSNLGLATKLSLPESSIENSSSEKLLWIVIEKNLYILHVSIYASDSKKNFNKCQFLLKVSILPIKYHSRKFNDRFKRLHKTAISGQIFLKFK